MQETHCPLCYQPLEVREVAPCHACGACQGELDHFGEGKHRYAEYEVFPGLRVVLCNICDIEFSQYDPVYFGLPPRTRVGFPSMRLVREFKSPAVERDKYCPGCGYRLAFLRFVQRARELHGSKAVTTDGYVHPSEPFDVICPKCGSKARFQFDPAVQEKQTPASYRHNLFRYGHASQNWGVCQCDRCVARFEHCLDWPREAFWKTTVFGELLWAHTCEELVVLRDYIASPVHEDVAYPGHERFLRHVPKVLLNAKRREQVLRAIDRLLESA